MSAIIVVTIEVQDPAKLAPYQELARPTMKEHGIRLLAKTPKADVLEGRSPGSMVVVLEAETAAAARAWYESAGYTKAIEARQGVAEFTTVVVPEAETRTPRAAV